jgi:hypothetical protein
MTISEDDASPLSDLIAVRESDLVKAIFGYRHWIDGIGNPPQTSGPIDWRLEVDLSRFGTARGDIDALIVSRWRVFQARAVQFKRIKVGPRSFTSGRLNKLPELKKLVRQTNLLHELGFAFVWATVVVVADMRSQIPARGLFPATPRELMDQVYSALPLNDLHDGVGVSICEINQVSDQPAHHHGGAGSHMVRAAVEQSQSTQLTNVIAEIFDAPPLTRRV